MRVAGRERSHAREIDRCRGPLYESKGVTECPAGLEHAEAFFARAVLLVEGQPDAKRCRSMPVASVLISMLSGFPS
jgi:hypothetical protein